MICKNCGAYISDDAVACPKCKAITAEGAKRQLGQREGRDDDDYQKVNQSTQERVEAGTLDEASGNRIVQLKENRRNIIQIDYSEKELKKLSKNWIIRISILVIVLVFAIAGTYIFLKKTESGQLILARRFKADSPQVYWIVGEEFLNKGDLVNAIRAFTLADAKDPNNSDGLLSLASAYEASNLQDQAERIYRRIITDISPNRSETYRALVRMLNSQDRIAEAAEVLRLAYNNTGIVEFKDQLNQILPEQPIVDLPGGRYNSEKYVNISSPQGYEIYYTLDSQKTALQGELYDGKPIKIPEGTVVLKAVCRSIELVSDPVEVKYILIYPSPSSPKSNLQPGTYGRRIPVSLRNTDEKEKDVVIHYTIDGSIPTENSPIYDGTPIEMPSGKVTLRAISVNNRGKMSNAQEVGYKFDAKPYPEKRYGEEDLFNGFEIGVTDIDTFFNQFGRSEDVKNSEYPLAKPLPSKIYNYPWGTVEFVLLRNKWIIASIDMHSRLTNEPRGVGFDNTEEEICKAFRDAGQKPNLDNTRGLYYDLPNIGKIDFDNDGKRYISYTCTTTSGNLWTIEYYLNSSGRVDRIVHYYK